MGGGQRFSVTLTGGSPWGFRLFGGESFPLQIAKVRRKSKADQMGMTEGDVILSINGVSMAGKSHQAAMYIVDNSGDSITFEISRSGTANVNEPVPVVNGYSTLQADDRNPTDLRVSPVANAQRRSPSPYQKQASDRMMTPNQDLMAYPVVNKRPHSPYQPKVTESAYTTRIGDTTAHVQTRQFQDSSPDGRQSRTVFQQRQVFTQTPNFKPKKVVTPTKPNVWQPVSAQKENVSPRKMPHFEVRNIKETIIATPSAKFKSGPPVPPKPLQERKIFEKNIQIFDLQDRQYIPDPCMFSHDYHFPEVKVLDDDDEIIDTHPHEDEFHHHHHHLPVFAPKVEISYEDFVNEQNLYNEGGYNRTSLPPLDLKRVTSLPESEATGPGTPDTESTGATTRKKKMYSDSAFFDNPEANYPTIEEQMELCKKIAQSLTSAANRKARGAKMFAKRRRKSAKWVHEEGTFASSSCGDIADLHDLDSEFYLDEGGVRPLFTFRIPNIKNRLAVSDSETHKMSLTQDEFERLRLNKKRCDHRTVSPNTCHSLVADLQSPKNRGAKLFQKRQARSEKWVIDESNARRPDVVPQTRLESMLSPKPSMSPWEAAMENPLGSVDGAFNHIDERDQLRRVNKNLQNMSPFSPQPVSVPYNTTSRSKTKLQTDRTVELLQGEDFNRKAKGWCPVGQSNERTRTRSTTEENYQQQTFRQEPPPAPPMPAYQDNYNRKIRAWNTGPQQTSSKKTEKSVRQTSSTSESSYGTYPGRGQKKMDQNYNYQMSSSAIYGSDL